MPHCKAPHAQKAVRRNALQTSMARLQQASDPTTKQEGKMTIDSKTTDLRIPASLAWRTSRTRLLALAVRIAISASAMSHSVQTAGSEQPALMDRQREIALALSTCPALQASKAAAFDLERSGYVKVREVNETEVRDYDLAAWEAPIRASNLVHYAD
jgi:hypothetical protein